MPKPGGCDRVCLPFAGMATMFVVTICRYAETDSLLAVFCCLAKRPQYCPTPVQLFIVSSYVFGLLQTYEIFVVMG